jgi:hypothetical protein
VLTIAFCAKEKKQPEVNSNRSSFLLFFFKQEQARQTGKTTRSSM